MKKILTVSLFAIMAVGAANADIASTTYVDNKVSTAKTEIDGTVATLATKETVNGINTRVTTAEGKITTAEGKITAAEDKISTLEGKVQSMEDGELAIGDGAVDTDQLASNSVTEAKLADNSVTEAKLADNSVTEAKLATELANKINAAQTATQVSTAIDGKITALNLANTYDAKGAASTAESKAKEYADGLNTAMDTRVDALEGAGYQNSTQVGSAIDAKITALNLANTYDAKGAASTAESNAKTYADGLNTAMDTRVDALEGAGYQNSTQVGTAIDTKIGALNLETTYEALDNKTQLVNESSTENQYPSAKAVFTAVNGLKGAISTENSARDSAIESAQSAADTAQATADANALAIQAINDGTNGILADAKSYTDTQDAATLASAKSYADTEDKKIEDSLGTVTAENMGTTASTVVGAIKEVKTATTENATAISKIDIAAAQIVETGASDGQYTLTMKKDGTNLIYYWEKIGR